MFVVKVNKNIATIEEREQITSGSQNVYVTQFEFSDEWQYLERTARFRAEDKIVDILLDDDSRCMIPWELMTKAKVSIEVGAYGVKDGNVVLPTIWAAMPIILQSVLGEDDAAWPSEPTPDVYQQILARLGELEDRIDEGGTGQNGKDGKDGKSAYQIAVDNGFEGTEEEWLASLQGPPGKDGSDDVINRCLWVYSAGDDIDLFKNGETNVAGLNEFIGHTPTVSNNNVGLVLVNSNLYWTKFDITAVAEDAITQSFTKDPVLIGPVAGGNMSESTLFVVNYNRAPKVGDYFNITPDRIYGAIPKNGEDYTLVAFTTDGIFDCTCVVTDYAPGKWATQVKVTTVSGVNSYSKEQIDEMFSGITIEDPLTTFKDTTITNISQLPVDKTPCCFHMVDSTLGFPFKDDIIYVKCVDPIVFVYTIDGVVAELDVGPEGQLTVKQVSSVRGDKGDPGESAYEIAVDNGFEGTEEEWLESLHGADGNDGLSPTVEVTDINGGHQVTITDAFGSQAFNVMDGQSVGFNAPIGAIVAWSKSIDEIPEGWHICDGNEGTLDLRDKFILGAGTTYTAGSSGGRTSVKLTVDEIPSHAHELWTRSSVGTGLANEVYSTTNTSNLIIGRVVKQDALESISGIQMKTKTVGNGDPFSIMPPYLAIIYIQKISASPSDYVTEDKVAEKIEAAIQNANAQLLSRISELEEKLENVAPNYVTASGY